MRKHTLVSILIVIIIILFVPFSVWNLVFAQKSIETARKNMRDTLMEWGEVFTADIGNKVRLVNTFAYEQGYLPGDLLTLYWTEDEKERQSLMLDVLYEAKSHIRTYEDAEAAYIYDARNAQCSIVRRIGANDLPGFRDTVGDESFVPAVNGWYIREAAGSTWLIHVVYNRDVYYGLCIDLNNYVSKIRSETDYDSLEVYFDTTGQYEEDENRLHLVCAVENRNIYLHLSIANDEFSRDLPVLQRLGLAIALLSVLMIPLQYVILRRLVVNPLKNLEITMETFKKDTDVRSDTRQHSREFTAVTESFNSMADEIVDLKIKDYENQLGQKQLQLENLQLQMNPHFLMNTFNRIYHLSQMKEYENIQKLVLYLSDYFRYLNEYGQKFSTVSKELELITKYVDAAKLQYFNKVELEIDVEEEIMDFPVLPLLLHNFVENFFKHGLVLERINHIQVMGYTDEDMVEFVVSDDGRGMPREMAAEFNEGIFEYKDNRHHTGLRNSYMRVKYFYNEKGSIYIDSDIEAGTTVIVRIPREMDQDFH